MKEYILSTTRQDDLMRLERQLDLDDAVKDWGESKDIKREGLFDWLKVLDKIDDDRVV